MRITFLEQVMALSDPEENILETGERMLLSDALDTCAGNQRKAARLLRISPRVMNYRLRKFDMRPLDILGGHDE